MAVFHPHTVNCVCGNALIVQLADSINVKRSPEARAKVLRGELHRAACPVCGRHMTVEKPFYYTDIDRNVLFKVFPRGERHTWQQASKDLDAASKLIPNEIADAGERTLRVVFGLDELREKLIAQDSGLDDRVVELLKVLLVYEHPILLRRSRLRLILQEVSGQALVFTANYEHNPRQYRLEMPLRVVQEVSAEPDRLKDWTRTAHKTSIFDLNDHWINMWRWSPQPTALQRLQDYAARLRAGKPVDTTEAAFQQMLTGLPRGTHLPPWAKQDLRILFEHAKEKGLQALQDSLFEIRFDIELEDDWSRNNDLNDIDTLWSLLKDLPDTNVEGNTKINELRLDVGDEGGTYSPTSNDISIGSLELMNRERFEDVVRHEVGHAVHEMHSLLVNGWLQQRFGWEVFGTTDQEIDQWVGQIGGWDPTMTGIQKREVRDALRTALGRGGSWTPGPTPSLSAGHPWYRTDFGPRLAFEATGANWFQNYQTWFTRNGKAFFLNYWYQTLMAVNTDTLRLVAAMPDPYAAMSHYEFFAELYALHYDADDPLRPSIPPDVSQWLNDHIGAPEIAAPMPAPPRAKSAWETIDRPGSDPVQ